MSDFIAKSPYNWETYLNLIKNFIVEEYKDIESITLVNRCINCFKKTRKVTLFFEDNKLIIDDWTLNCNFGNKEYQHKHTIENFNIDNTLFKTEVCKSSQTMVLLLKYYSGIDYSIPLTSYYPSKDYEVHGTKVYQDRNLKMIQREVDNGLVIMLQNFIDFKGLDPRFSDTIFIKWK